MIADKFARGKACCTAREPGNIDLIAILSQIRDCNHSHNLLEADVPHSWGAGRFRPYYNLAVDPELHARLGTRFDPQLHPPELHRWRNASTMESIKHGKFGRGEKLALKNSPKLKGSIVHGTSWGTIYVSKNSLPHLLTSADTDGQTYKCGVI